MQENVLFLRHALEAVTLNVLQLGNKLVFMIQCLLEFFQNKPLKGAPGKVW